MVVPALVALLAGTAGAAELGKATKYFRVSGTLNSVQIERAQSESRAVSVELEVTAREGRSNTGAGTSLRDRFSVADGTRLVGTIFPDVVRYPNPAYHDVKPDGWEALLSVETDAASVIKDFITQAQRLGFHQSSPGNCCSCVEATGGGVSCSGLFVKPARYLEIFVRVCGTCSPPMSVARLRMSPNIGGIAGSSAITPLAANSPTLMLTQAERRELKKSIPRRGDPFAPHGKLLHVLPGSQMLLPGIPLGACTADFIAVLRLTGESQPLFERYVSQTYRDRNYKVRTARRRVGRYAVTQARRESWTVTLVENGGLRSPLLLMDLCGEHEGV
jgi:hypothetical protein